MGILGQTDARTDTNRWQGGDGGWQTKKLWSLNQLPNSGQNIVIGNTGVFTVVIDEQTASNFPTAMTVSSLSMSNTAGSTTLLLSNGPADTIPITFTISNSAVIGAGLLLKLIDASTIGAGVIVQVSNLVADSTILLPSNVTLSANSSLLLGSTASNTGGISILGGTLIGSPSVGNGSLLISNGVLQAGSVNVGVLSGAHGLWQIAGGGNSVSGGISIGVAPGATGDVVVASGELSSSGSISVGVQGVGRLVTSNGFLQTPTVGVGVLNGGRGIWQIAGGSNVVDLRVTIGVAKGATGAVDVSGGELTAVEMNLGGDYVAQQASVGSLIISNGVVNVPNLFMAGWLNGVGTITVAGGNLHVTEPAENDSGNLYIGLYGTGTVWQTGGEIDVTNNFNQYCGLIRLVGEVSGGTYLSQLICSGGVLRASEVDVGHPDPPTFSGSSFWTIAGGTSIVNSAVYVENVPRHISLLTVSGGLLQTPRLGVGSLSGGGAVVISGGVVQLSQALAVGLAPGPTSQVSIAGGNLAITGGFNSVYIGGGGQGQIVVSSGSFSAGTIYVGSSPANPGNQAGTLTISGGSVQGHLLIGESGGSGATGTVWYTGGDLQGFTTVGDTGVGSMYVLSNAFFHPLGFMVIGNQSGSVGSLSLQGGTSFGSRELDDLTIGYSAGSSGTVWVTDGLLLAGEFGSCGGPVFVGVQGSGRLSATNSTLYLYGLSVGSQGTFECVNSQLSLFNLCTAVNNNSMVFVNSTGTFSGPVQNDGSIVVNNSTLTFSQPVNNSGWIVATNGSVQFQGGIANSGAVLLGPDQFYITSIVATGNDVAITWPVFGGNHYRVQAASSITDNFFDITSDIVPPSGSGLGVTNYLDAGSLTNFPGRFYRIRQIY